MKINQTRRRGLLFLGAVLLTTGILCVASTKWCAAEENLLEVAEVAWTAAVQDLQFTNRYADAGRVPLAPICLWMRMRASQKALAQLKAQGKLPVRHRWIRYSGYDADVETLKPTDMIDLGVGTPEVLTGLEREVNDRGWFDWRTWSRKENLIPGKWEVEIVYSTGEPVLCTADGDHEIPCRYSIEVSR